MTIAEPALANLPDRGLIHVAGPDARAFLHAQTTQRISDLGTGETRLAAWLTAKGRIRALFDIVPEGNAFWLVLPAELRDDVARQLGLFVLRAKVSLTPVDDRKVVALAGVDDAWLERHGLAVPLGGVVIEGRGDHAGTGADADADADADGAGAGAGADFGSTIRFRTVAGRVDLIGTPAALDARLAELRDVLPVESPDRAVLELISAGRPEITAATRERYTPHMLNLERLGGVSFSKGCYPGQEIVARTQNLGAAKRRIMRFRVAGGARPRPGDEIADASVDVVGEINCAAATADGYELLAVVPVETDGRGLALGTDGRGLTRLPLPWDEAQATAS